MSVSVSQTIENVLAQGGMEYRRRLVSLELAVRLLELSQSAKNEALQTSCGMAVSHLLLLVLTAHHYPPSLGNISNNNSTNVNANTTRGNNNNNPAASARGQTNNNNSNNLNSTVTVSSTVSEIFTAPSALRSAKFLAKVLEKGGLPGIIEVLRDGAPKLQQAYLNIINMLFASPIPAPVEADKRKNNNNNNNNNNANVNSDVSQANLQSINVVLRMSRTFFMKSAALTPILLNLMEQGALSAVRGKALLALQLICKFSPSILASLTEKRLPTLLVRVLAPIITEQEAHPEKVLNNQELPYFTKTAFSMLYFVRGSCVEAVHRISEQLVLLVANPSGITGSEIQQQAGQYESPVKGANPAAGGAFNSRKASPASPMGKYATPGGLGGPGTTAAPSDALDTTTTVNAGGGGGGVVSAAVLQSSADVVCAVASTASHPTLRRFILAADGLVAQVVAQAMHALPTARTALENVTATHTAQQQQLQNGAGRGKSAGTPGSANNNGTVLRALEDALTSVEQCCLVSLEMLSQVKLQHSSNRYFAELIS